MVRDGEAAVRWPAVPEKHVTAPLVIDFIADFYESLHQLASRNHQ
jgi:hypothetical protein